ncbi:MAG: GIVxVP protein [Synechococcaceae cyanobacterium ELA182]
MAAAAWAQGPAESNRSLAITLGAILMGSGLLAQLLPEPSRESEETDPAPPGG